MRLVVGASLARLGALFGAERVARDAVGAGTPAKNENDDGSVEPTEYSPSSATVGSGQHTAHLCSALL